MGRGANLDLIDNPLNERKWLKIQFDEIRKMSSDEQRHAAIDKIMNWTDPGPGGFYDNLGNLTQQPHLLRGLGAEKDPEFRASSRVGFRDSRDWRLAWCCFAESRYDAPLQMRYEDLDPSATYRIRVVYSGRPKGYPNPPAGG